MKVIPLKTQQGQPKGGERDLHPSPVAVDRKLRGTERQESSQSPISALLERADTAAMLKKEGGADGDSRRFGNFRPVSFRRSAVFGSLAILSQCGFVYNLFSRSQGQMR